jgi:hypothetical protein
VAKGKPRNSKQASCIKDTWPWPKPKQGHEVGSFEKEEDKGSKGVQSLLASSTISDRILDSGWIQGVCADILSHT